jgi:hypothetical protein
MVARFDRQLKSCRDNKLLTDKHCELVRLLWVRHGDPRWKPLQHGCRTPENIRQIPYFDGMQSAAQPPEEPPAPLNGEVLEAEAPPAKPLQTRRLYCRPWITLKLANGQTFTSDSFGQIFVHDTDEWAELIALGCRQWP